MKKHRTLSLSIVLSILMAWSLAVPAFAEEAPAKELNVNGEGSGYKIVIPRYVETKKVTTTDSTGKSVQLDVIVVERPALNENDAYPIYTVVRTAADESYAVEALAKTFADNEEIDFYHAGYNDNQASYEIEMNRTVAKDLKNYSGDTVFDFNFVAVNPDWAAVFQSKGLYFMFVDPGTKPSGTNGQAGGGTGANAGPSSPGAGQQGGSGPVTAKPASAKVMVNGKAVDFEAYTIDGNNYFKLRDLAKAVNGTDKQFEVGWDGAHNAIQLSSAKAYTSIGSELVKSANPKAQAAKVANSKLYIDGKEVSLKAYSIGGFTYFKLRDIAKAIDFNVTWDAKNNAIGIDTKSSYIEP